MTSLAPAIKAYVLSKGLPASVAGSCVDAVELVKAALAWENPQTPTPEMVVSCTEATLCVIPFACVSIGNPRHFDAVQPRPPVARENSPLVWGIVVNDETTGVLRLVDGYHRMKVSDKGSDQGLFIVLR